MELLFLETVEPAQFDVSDVGEPLEEKKRNHDKRKSTDATSGIAQYKNPSSPICSTTTSTAANVATDCEGIAPHNETSIAINPKNPNNMIASANDYQLANGGSNETIFSRAHVTVDGGTTWTTATRVASGSGSFGSVGIFNDKEYIAAWGDGNAIVTWSRFNDLQKGAYGGSPIYASVTHDGGKTWTKGVEISGAALFCASFTAGCDENQNSTPVVAADGSIYVSFLTTRDNSNGRDAYAVVQVDPQTGQRIAGPFKVADLFDGVGDYPVSAFGDTTYQDSVFRTWSAGNMTADPTNAQHLAVSWSDMRNSTLTSTNPYATTTNSDVGVAESFDGGRTWTTKIFTVRNDQFFPWAAFDGTGKVRVGYMDRSYDAANHKYGFTLATETSPGSLTFATQQVTTVLSDPTKDDRWFSGTTVNPAFPHPTSFIGDYNGIAAGPNGIATTWTDLRAQVTFGTRSGSGENAEFALVH